MKKKKLLIGLVGCLFLSLLAIGGTLAWLVDDAKVTNTVSIGKVDIEINETWDETDGQDIVPGVYIDKIPTVKNIGKNPAYIRAKVVITNDYFTDLLEIDFNNENWFKEGEYYYYKEIVNINTSTKPLFTKFKLSDDYIEPQDSENPGFNIDVYAEAIQSEGFEPEDNTEAKFRDAILNAFNNY